MSEKESNKEIETIETPVSESSNQTETAKNTTAKIPKNKAIN